MAFEPDPKRPGCYYEPSIEVRNLALQAYNLCPELAKKDDPTPDAIKGSSEGEGTDETEGVSEGEGASSDDDDTVEPALESPSPDDDSEGDNGDESDSGDDSDSGSEGAPRLQMNQTILPPAQICSAVVSLSSTTTVTRFNIATSSTSRLATCFTFRQTPTMVTLSK